MSKTAVGPFALNTVLTSAQMTTVDANASGCIDKSAAGDTCLGPYTYSGASASITMAATAVNGITIATGSKLVVNGAMTLGAASATTMTAGATFTVNGASNFQTGAAGAIALNGGTADWISYLATRSYNKTIPLRPFSLSTGWTIPPGNIRLSAPATTQNIIIPIDTVHNGAKFQTMSMFIEVVSHANVPAVLPSFDVRRKGLIAGAETDVSLFSTGAKFFPTPASGAAWTASGNVQTWFATPDQNFTIDTTQYLYYVVLLDENGVNSVAGNTYLGMIVNYSTIANSAPA